MAYLRLKNIFLLASVLFFFNYCYAQKKESVKKKTTLDPSLTASSQSPVTVSSGEINSTLKEKYESVEETYFTFLDDALKNPDAVYKLRLTNQNLTAVPADISKFKNLVSLDLSNNQITELPSALFSLTNLVELNLGDNQLTTVTSQLCTLKNLENLSLNGNKITSIGSEISCLTNLQKLFLQNNEITSLSSDIGNLKNLRYLYLFGNSLTKVPGEICGLSQLQVLLLSYNRLKETPSGLEKLKFLRYYSEDGQLLDDDVYQDVVINNPDYANEENLKKTTERKVILDSYNHVKKPTAQQVTSNTSNQQNYSSHPVKKRRIALKVIGTIAVVYVVMGLLAVVAITSAG